MVSRLDSTDIAVMNGIRHRIRTFLGRDLKNDLEIDLICKLKLKKGQIECWNC